MTIIEFRRRFRIPAARWREMVESGSAPTIHKGELGLSMISDEAAQAWFAMSLDEFLAWDQGESDSG